jgi:hypothetical protein
MTYASVHGERLRETVTVAADGGFRFEWDRKEPLTVVVESSMTMGSYHMPRYAVRTLEPHRDPVPLLFDFGVSHLENHPTTEKGAGP